MDLRWDWLAPLLSAPYVPALGPVHPSLMTAQRFTDVLAVAGTGAFVPYDKDRRWAVAKAETVLPASIVQRPDETLIPTLDRRGPGLVKVHLYGTRPATAVAATALARALRAAHGAAQARVVSFLPSGEPAPPGTAVRILLKDFTTSPCPPPGSPVVSYADTPAEVRSTFTAFAAAMAAEGFTFLHERMQAGTAGPVLVSVTGGRVSGAIGPMETCLDAAGARQLLPQYFAVVPRHRGEGLGRALWRAAMCWGQQHGAAYQLLQTRVGGASDRLCQAEGLVAAGFVHTLSA